MREAAWIPGLRWLIVMVAVAVASVPLLARAQPVEQDTIEYRVRQGETLIGLARQYMRDANSYRAVQARNGIRNPRRIAVGTRLVIPVSLLRQKPARLTVAGFSGPVELRSADGALPLAKGAQVPAGTIVTTGQRGFISFAGDAGSTISIPSQSSVRIHKAYRYLIDNRLDVELRILRGRGTFQPPKLDAVDRYRVTTPVAVSAVRGTVFRVFYEEEASKSGTGVLEGSVALSGTDGATDVPEGFGVIARQSGLDDIEALLPAPQILDPAPVRTGETVAFALGPVPGGRGYRTQIASDAGFLDILAEEVSDEPRAVFADIPNGRLFVRTRAIAESGLEGFAEAYSFRRQRLGVAASVETDPLANGFAFAWESEGEGSPVFNFRLWSEGNEDLPLVSEVGMTERKLTVTDLPSGVYFWQVGAVVVADGDVVNVWGPAQKLTVSE